MKFTNTPPRLDMDEIYEDEPINDDDLEIIEMNPDGEIILDDEAEENDEDLEQDDSKHIFREHKEALTCCALNKSETLIASGGEDDRGFLWDLETGEVLLKSQEHKDSIISIGFSHDGKYVAFGDMAPDSEGVIHVYQIESKTLHHTIEELSDLQWMHWHPSKNLVLAGQGNGDCTIVDVETKELSYWASGKNTPTTCGSFIADTDRAVIAFDDGCIQVWELNAYSPLLTLRGDGEMITTLSCSSDGSFVVAGNTNWTVNLYLVQASRAAPLKKIHTWLCTDPEVEDEKDKMIESVTFSPDSRYVCVGLLSGLIFVYDKSTKGERLQFRSPDWITKCIWDPTLPLLYATCLYNGCVSVFDTRDGSRKESYHGHRGDVYDLCISTKNNLIITAAEDHTCRIFEKRQVGEVGL